MFSKILSIFINIIQVLFYIILVGDVIWIVLHPSPSLHDVAFLCGMAAIFAVTNHLDLKAIRKQLDE